MPSAFVVVLSVLGALLMVGIIVRRPRLVLSPLLIPLAVGISLWRKAKVIWALPENVTKWFAYSVLEKDAHALRHHAETSAALWAAGPAFRQAAREVARRVCSGYGISLEDGDGELPLPLQTFGPQDPDVAARHRFKFGPQDPYDAMKVAAAAEAVGRGVPIVPVDDPEKVAKP